LAAAAAVLLIVWSPFAVAPKGEPATPVVQTGTEAVVRLVVHREPEIEIKPPEAPAPDAVARDSGGQPDVFLMIEPPAVAAIPASEPIGF
jgi:hypothetical protein